MTDLKICVEKMIGSDLLEIEKVLRVRKCFKTKLINGHL